MECTEISGVFLSGPYRKGGPGLRSGNVYVAGFTTGGLDGNTSAETFKECGERFGIEENFPGDKSNGFGWEESRLRDPEAPGRLVLVTATATLCLSLQGARVEAGGRRTEADPHWFRGLSYFRIGWNWIKRALEHGERILQAWVFPKHFRPAPAQASRKQHQALLRQRSQRFRLREDTWDCGYLL